MVELIVGLLLFMILTTAVSTLFLPMLRAFSRANDLAEINMLLDSVSNEILGDVRVADIVKIDSSGIATELKVDNVAEYSVDGGLLTRNGWAVFDRGYYKGKTVALEYLAEDGTALPDGRVEDPFVVRITLFYSSGDVASIRDYAVHPIGFD